MTEYDYSPEAYERYIATQQRIASWVDQHANSGYVPPHLRASVQIKSSAPSSDEVRTKIKSGALSRAKRWSDTTTHNPFLKYHSQSPKTKFESQPPMSHNNTPSQFPKTPDPGTTPYSLRTRHRIERSRRRPPQSQAQAPPQPNKNYYCPMPSYPPPPPPPPPQDILRSLGTRPGTPKTTRPIATPARPAFQAPGSPGGRIILPLWDHPDPPVSCVKCHLQHKPPRSRSSDNPTQTATPPAPPHCHTCYTTSTPLWRKDIEGNTVCNACGLYSRRRSRRSSENESDDIPTPTVVSRCASPASRSSPTLASDSSARLSYESGKDISEFKTITDSSEFIGGCGLTDISVHVTQSHSIPPLHWSSDSHPRSTKHSDTQTLITNLRRQSDVDDGGLPMLPLHHRGFPFSDTPDRPPFPHTQPRPDNNERPSVDYDLSSRLQEHAALQLALTAFLATVTLSVVCPDGKQDVLEVCRALSILRPFFVLVHFGAALATCGILFTPQNGRFAVSSHHLRLFWTVFFGLGLCCIMIQLTLYACTVGNLMTTLLTAVVAVFCALPGFYLIVLKWYYPKPRAAALEQGGL